MKWLIIFIMGISLFWQIKLLPMESKVVENGDSEAERFKQIKIRKLSGFDALRDYKPTSPRTAAFFSPNSPRAEGKACCLWDDSCNCFFYYCLCMPLCYMCCQSGNDSYNSM